MKKTNNTITSMNNTIEDFSSFFRPNKEKEKFLIYEFIKETIELNSEDFDKNNITINIFCKLNLYIFTYKNELKQVLLNILNNSKDAIQINTINKGKIDIKIIELKDSIEILIEDNAGGIKEDIIDKIFEPYFTTKFKSNGTGIGLYMCKVIIEDSLKGEISIKNKNDGIICKITLPLKEKYEV